MSMPRPFITKAPIAVEAIRLSATTVHRAAAWSKGVEVEEIDPLDHSRRFVALNVPTENGVIRVQEGEWLVKDPKGRFSKATNEDWEEYMTSVEETQETNATR